MQPEWQGGQKWVGFTQVLLSYRGYLIAAPSVFRSGVEEVISVTIFNSPRDVMVQAQLVAQGEAVARSQGTILGRSPGCLARTPAVRTLLCFSPSPPPSRGGRAGCLFPILQMGRVRPRRDSHLPCLGNQRALSSAARLLWVQIWTEPGIFLCRLWLELGPGPRGNLTTVSDLLLSF